MRRISQMSKLFGVENNFNKSQTWATTLFNKSVVNANCISILRVLKKGKEEIYTKETFLNWKCYIEQKDYVFLNMFYFEKV